MSRSKHLLYCEALKELCLTSGPTGISRLELCRITGQDADRAQVRLRRMLDAGVIARAGKSRMVVYGAPGVLVEPQLSKKQAANSARKRRIAEARNADEFERCARVRIVSALEASPLRPTGPASVWALGRAA